MTIQDCYRALGGDYADVKERLNSDALIERFIGKFLEDDSYGCLCRAMDAGRRADAFRAAHTLKGVSATLGFTVLYASSERLTECLRPSSEEISADAVSIMEEVRQDYTLTVTAIRSYLNGAAL